MSRRRRGGRKNAYQGDKFTKQAKNEGYAARSVYKLVDIQKRFRVFKPGMRVLDLGCAPGSWLKYAVQQVGPKGAVAGIDIAEVSPAVPGAVVLQDDIYKVTGAELAERVGGPVDVVLSDMAPRTTGNKLGDHVRQIELAQRAADLAVEVLKPGGHFVVKVFDGEDAHDYVQGVRPHFDKCKRVRPEAVRRESVEFFLVCLNKKDTPPAE